MAQLDQLGAFYTADTRCKIFLQLPITEFMILIKPMSMAQLDQLGAFHTADTGCKIFRQLPITDEHQVTMQ